MKLKVVGMRGAKLAMAGLALLLIVSCGGGTQVEKYVPTRVLAFGDENSVIESDGRKYTVNGLSSDGLGTIDCQASALWNSCSTWATSASTVNTARTPETLWPALQMSRQRRGPSAKGVPGRSCCDAPPLRTCSPADTSSQPVCRSSSTSCRR